MAGAANLWATATATTKTAVQSAKMLKAQSQFGNNHSLTTDVLKRLSKSSIHDYMYSYNSKFGQVSKRAEGPREGRTEVTAGEVHTPLQNQALKALPLLRLLRRTGIR